MKLIWIWLKSRSTWACELKCFCYVKNNEIVSHAPRERVSWNYKFKMFYESFPVTLHVSVWVEIILSASLINTLMSRSTWACELKLPDTNKFTAKTSHAPRERVSWNYAPALKSQLLTVTLHVSVWVEIKTLWCSRYLLAVTLHVSVWVEIII